MADVFTTSIAGARQRGLGALALTMDKSLYHVGEAPSYAISGAAPNSAVAWSSTRDGLSTGENQSSYGQTTNADGVWSGGGNAWTNEQQGWWTKTAIVNGENATRSFQVVPAVAVGQPAPNTQQASNSFFSSTINLFGYDVPSWAVYAGGALLAYILLFKKR